MPKYLHCRRRCRRHNRSESPPMLPLAAALSPLNHLLLLLLPYCSPGRDVVGAFSANEPARCDKHLCQVSNNFCAPNWVFLLIVCFFSLHPPPAPSSGCAPLFGRVVDWMTRRLSACRQIFLMIFVQAMLASFDLGAVSVYVCVCV